MRRTTPSGYSYEVADRKNYVEDFHAAWNYESSMSGHCTGNGCSGAFSLLYENESGEGWCRTKTTAEGTEYGMTVKQSLEEISGGSHGAGRGFREWSTGMGRQHAR